MKLTNSSQTTDANNSNSRSGPPPNPYTLFLILILLINSFGGINHVISSIKNIFRREEEGWK
ncbi:MAG: hypothetical protein GX892_08740 [Thermoanaerobacteraceae bacterium]|nr:hypothetical protein [Thermoanaerobacteraceae bacterium]